MSRIRFGIETLFQHINRNRVQGRRVGLVAHPASCTNDYVHSFDLLRNFGVNLEIVFGPEHGFLGEAQDMESVDGRARHPSGVPVVSLYGKDEKSLSPRDEDIRGLDVLIVDLADVGSRYYTYIWTALLCLRVCHRLGVEVIVTDRPNPLGGVAVEGAPQNEGFLSFVGLYPIANRHGMTPGEVLTYAAHGEGLSDALYVQKMEGWLRTMNFADSGAVWVMPSPNMPTLDTALVYPGLCLLEATWASEGRGTTKPFELVGAPLLDSVNLKNRLDGMGLPGIKFRPVSFKPGFQKHWGTSCGGVQLHVTDPGRFKPYLTGVAMLLALKQEAGEGFAWREDPYEFEMSRPAVDLLTGSTEIRELIEEGATLEDLASTWQEGEASFRELREPFLLY